MEGEIGTAEKERDDWVREYYAAKGKQRNDLLGNPGVLFQVVASDVSLIRALQSIRPDTLHAKVLDVGCGRGSSLIPFIYTGFLPGNLYGIDIGSGAIADAQERFPNSHFVHGDASRMNTFADETFDIVFESTMFVMITNEGLAKTIAAEMIRVTRTGGQILLRDWVVPKPGDHRYKPLTRKRVAGLFDHHCTLRSVFNAALVPPLGRFLSAHAPAAYFLVRACFPFLVGSKVYVLQVDHQ